MTKQEIQLFIEEMSDLGDVWEEDEVQRIYGNASLKDSLAERKSQVQMCLNNIACLFRG